MMTIGLLLNLLDKIVILAIFLFILVIGIYLIGLVMHVCILTINKIDSITKPITEPITNFIKKIKNIQLSPKYPLTILLCLYFYQFYCGYTK